MKVSIIIPVYNSSMYIERCMRSVLAQTYSDIECLLIDDCSVDNSMELVRNMLSEYKGAILFSIIKHEKNRGLSAARNTGIQAATGDFLYFLDSDDAIDESCIELLSNLAIKYEGVDMVQGNCLRDGKDNVGYSLKRGIPEYVDGNKMVKALFYETSMPCTAWNKLLRRNFLVEYHLFFKENIYHEDILWSYYLAKYMHSFAVCYLYTYLYFINNNSITKSIQNNVLQRRNSSWKTVIKDIVIDMEYNKCYIEYKRFPYKCYMYYNAFILEMKSWKLYPSFWKFVLQMAFHKKRIYGIYDFLFYLSMLPPFCLLFLSKSFHWRFMNKIFIKL